MIEDQHVVRSLSDKTYHINNKLTFLRFLRVGRTFQWSGKIRFLLQKRVYCSILYIKNFPSQPMYFALDEFFLQRTQHYTHIKNLVNAPISAIGYEKDITLCKPLHAISLAAIFVYSRAVRRLSTTKSNSQSVSFVGESWCCNLDPRVLSHPSWRVEERTWERGCVMSMILRVSSVEMLHKTQNFAPFDPKCWYNVRKIKKDNLPYVFSRVLQVRFCGVFKNIR